jgi:acyl carrier protein
MCGKLGENEIESMRNMLTMVVYAVLADIFNKDISAISQNNDLQNDLGMTMIIQRKLDIAINDIFDDLHLDFERIKTVQDVIDQVIDNKMAPLTGNQT